MQYIISGLAAHIQLQVKLFPQTVLTDAIGNESVPISNHNAFRVLFDKIASVYLFEKYAYILSLEMASTGNQHCDNVLGYWHTFVPYS